MVQYKEKKNLNKVGPYRNRGPNTAYEKKYMNLFLNYLNNHILVLMSSVLPWRVTASFLLSPFRDCSITG